MAKIRSSASQKVPAKSSASGIDRRTICNEILLSLPAKECRTILSELEFVEMRSYDLLNEMGEPIKFCYFMNSGMTSILTVMGDGKEVKVGLTGKEGFIGLPLVVGLKTSATRAIVQITGSAFRLGASQMVQALSKCPDLARRLNRYAQELAMQATQVAACNRLHDVEARLARWLLMSQDRVASGVTSKAANGGHFKTGQRKWPGTRLFYSDASCGGKSVFVRQLRGPHLSTWP